MRRQWAQSVIVLGAYASAASCIPADTTTARGGIAVTLVPSEATRVGRFMTRDGWDVTVVNAWISVFANASDCTGSISADEYGWGGTGGAIVGMQKGGLIEIRAASPSTRCVLRLMPQSVYVSGDPDGDFAQVGGGALVIETGKAFRMRGSAVKTTGSDRGRTLRFDFQLDGFSSSEEAPARDISIPSGDKSDARAELALEALFVPDERSPIGFGAQAQADANGDGELTAAELEADRPDDGSESATSWPYFALSARLNRTLRFLP